MHSRLLLSLFITTTLGRGRAGSTPHTPELTLTDNPGLHAFTYHGSFADDISFGKLILQINTKTMVRTVKKAADTMNRKLCSPSPFLKLMGRRIMESVNPATQRLETLDAILYQAKQSKRDLLGLAAMATAGYAIYDIRQLRGDLGQLTDQQHVIEASLPTAVREMEDLNLAAANTKMALHSLLKNVTDMELSLIHI